MASTGSWRGAPSSPARGDPDRANFTFEIPEGEEPVLNVMGLPGDGHDCSARTTG